MSSLKFLALIVHIEASLLKREGRSSNHTGFVTEAGWKKLEVFFESRTELGAQVFFKRLKQKVTSFGDAAAIMALLEPQYSIRVLPLDHHYFHTTSQHVRGPM